MDRRSPRQERALKKPEAQPLTPYGICHELRAFRGHGLQPSETPLAEWYSTEHPNAANSPWRWNSYLASILVNLEAAICSRKRYQDALFPCGYAMHRLRRTPIENSQ